MTISEKIQEIFDDFKRLNPIFYNRNLELSISIISYTGDFSVALMYEGACFKSGTGRTLTKAIDSMFEKESDEIFE